MKRITIFSAAAFFFGIGATQAQVNLQNTGTLYITGAPDILYINGSLTNTSTGSLTNNGSLYVLQNLVNDQSTMAIGTGSLYFSGSAAQTLSGSQPFKTYNLVTNNGAGILLNNNLSVSGAHTFTAGIVTTSATPNYLVYEAGSSYTGDGDTKHVNGWISKTGATAFTFPLGNGVVERRIATSNLSASSVFNAAYAGLTTNLSNVASPLVTVDRHEYWIVNKISGGTASINMNWDNSKVTMPPYIPADIRVASYTAGNWTQAGGSAAGNITTTGTISSAVASSFGPLTFASISFALPVNLVQFTAYKNNEYAIVSWTTSDELNVHNYEVQRSDDGIGFYVIGNVAARNSSGLQQYEFADTRALKPVTYYRMRSVDLDGKSKLSKVVKVSNSDLMDRYLTVVNPVRNSIHLTAKNLSGDFEYRINTLAGQTMQQGFLKITAAGTNDINLSTAVKTGMYILQVQKTGFSFSEKVLVE